MLSGNRIKTYFVPKALHKKYTLALLRGAEGVHASNT